MQIPYYHVDAFTGELFGGNPAGVCVLSSPLDDSIMQKIAAENRHSETAFVVPRIDGDFDLRWFTPEIEDDLCGHATMASAYVLALQQHEVWPVHFHTRSGVLTVARVQDKFEMDFPARPAVPCIAPDDSYQRHCHHHVALLHQRLPHSPGGGQSQKLSCLLSYWAGSLLLIKAPQITLSISRGPLVAHNVLRNFGAIRQS
jgi:predicted PhzF superfamily epimerase YddE/YHI9